MRRLVTRGVWLVPLLLALAGCGGAEQTGSAAGSERLPRVGILRVVSDEDHRAFVDELRSRGWSAGADVVLLPRDPGNIYATTEQAEAALRDWTREGIDIVIAFSTPFAQLVAEQAPDVPSLFLVNDPVAAGLVGDMRAPEGSMTGVSFRTPADRTLDLADRALGGIERVGYLAPVGDPAVPGHRESVRVAAAKLGYDFLAVDFDGVQDVAAAVAELASSDVDAVFLASSNSTVRAIEQIERELRDQRLPAIASVDFFEFAAVALAPDPAELRRQLARQAARLLSGASVSSIPVEDPRKFVVIINRTEIERLGLPPVREDLLRQADVVR